MNTATSPRPSADPAAVLPLPVTPLARLCRLMADDGWAVDASRFCTDRRYAQDCLATAHASSNSALRATALQLFEAFSRNAASSTLH